MLAAAFSTAAGRSAPRKRLRRVGRNAAHGDECDLDDGPPPTPGLEQAPRLPAWPDPECDEAISGRRSRSFPKEEDARAARHHGAVAMPSQPSASKAPARVMTACLLYPADDHPRAAAEGAAPGRRELQQHRAVASDAHVDDLERLRRWRRCFGCRRLREWKTGLGLGLGFRQDFYPPRGTACITERVFAAHRHGVGAGRSVGVAGGGAGSHRAIAEAPAGRPQRRPSVERGDGEVEIDKPSSSGPAPS
jgi:hypothetical protein